jgi:hypothetical protein
MSAARKSDKVVELPRNVDLNRIFFHKSMVEIGTVFIYLGRMAPNTRWKVTNIVTRTSKNGMTYPRSTTRCERLGDDLTMVCLDTDEARTATFGYMSYSAIWCIA